MVEHRTTESAKCVIHRQSIIRQTGRHRAARATTTDRTCTTCHTHLGGFMAPADPAAAPHGAVACSACHDSGTYVLNAAIANAKCQSCHATGQPGSTLKVDRHYSDNYTDPTTGVLADIKCVECHNPMSVQSNLSCIRSTIRTKAVVFTAVTGSNSFGDGGAPYNGICEVCRACCK